MPNLLRVLIVPLAIELINNVVHGLVRDTTVPTRLHYTDVISIAITVAILLYVGWRVATIYTTRPILKAAGIGLLLWLISTIVFTGGAQVVQSLFASAPNSSDLMGPVIAFALFAPAAAVVPILGAFARIKIKQTA